MKAASQAVKKSRAAAGIRSTSVYLADDDKARWKALAAERGESMGETLIAALDALEAAGDPTPEQAVRILARHFKVRA